MKLDRENQIYSAVYVVLEKDDKILLMRRYKTGYCDGMYTLPAGHIETNELPTETAIRETLEEVGVELNKDNLDFVHTMYRVTKGERTYVDIYLKAKTFTGEAKICEDDKCDDIGWYSLKNLPENIMDNVELALSYIEKGIKISEDIK